MTESLSHIVVGEIGAEAVIVDAVAAAANITLWSPVIREAAGSGEDLPRVNTTATLNSAAFGVVVSPLRDATNNYASLAIGDLLKVCVFGRCKVRVDGSGANIAIGDGLVTSTTAGRAVKVDYSSADNTVGNINTAILALGAIFAKAEKASVAVNDIIPCFVKGSRGNTA